MFAPAARADPREVVDLSASQPPPAAAAASAVAIDVIELLDDDEYDALGAVACGGGGGGRRRRKRKRQHATLAVGVKTDPNERHQHQQVFGLDDEDVQVVESHLYPTTTTSQAQTPATTDPHQLAILEVVPDVDLNHVKALLQKHSDNAELALAELLDSGNSYPKAAASAASSTTAASTFLTFQSASASSSFSAPTKYKYDYMLSSSFIPTKLYKEQAALQLAHDFCFLSKPGAVRLLASAHGHYAIAHDKIVEAVKGTKIVVRATSTSPTATTEEDLDVSQYHRLQSALAANALDYTTQIRSIEALVTSNKSNVSLTLKTPRKHKNTTFLRPFVTDAILVDEIRYVSEKLKAWMTNVERKTQRETNKIVCQRAGTAVECGCCFDSFDIQDMVACREEGHLFCVDCLRNFAQDKVFGSGNLGIDTKTKQPALELTCFASDGCTSGFHRSCLEKSLPLATLRKYDELQFQLSIQRAGLNDMVECPKCNYQAALPLGMKVFACPECAFESCRECGEAAHIPLRCDEVEKEAETKGRLTVEEAITAAKIRKCPKCSKGFIKSDGCNKITCSCGIFVCYICRIQIKDYTHFCQTPHCQHESCHKCPLWTKGEEDDARAMKEAGLQAATKVQSESQGFQIDVESILKDPTG